MALHIAFPDDVEAIFTAQLGEPGGIGIVAGADGVDVVLLHEQQIFPGLVPADGVAGNRVAVVAVDALKLNRCAVVVQHAVLGFHFEKAYFLVDALLFCPKEQLVLVRLFRVPEPGGFHPEGKLSPLGRALGQEFSLRAVKPAPYSGGTHCIHINRHMGSGKILFQLGVDKVVPDTLLGPEQQVHVPENAGHPQFVLIL